LSALREPAALPGWLATTTQRECLRVLRVNSQADRRNERLADEMMTAAQSVEIEEEIIAAEWNRVLSLAFGELLPPCRQLLSMLMQEPPVPYAEISRRLGIPVGGIGPSRARCLAKMRRYPPLAALLEAEQARRGGEVDV
jgi:RNA polymerase sigma factor (sigma-70 family)